MVWKPELDDLARREAFAREMGGVDKVKRQRDQGRLTVRERIDKLTDVSSFHEIGAIAGIGGTRWYRFTTENLSRVPVVALGLGSVAGLGAARLAASHYSIMTKKT
jgi:acetyl-CoA carboxylase carboxyltransferase component